jgi:hypothetical protein
VAWASVVVNVAVPLTSLVVQTCRAAERALACYLLVSGAAARSFAAPAQSRLESICYSWRFSLLLATISRKLA